MIFRKAIKSDLKEIMNIINQSKEYFRLMKIDQWQDGYPNEETIINDIENHNSYVLEKDSTIIATAMFGMEKDHTYDKIYGGTWLTEDDYAVIHRIAVLSEYKGDGVAKEIVKNAEKICLANGLNSIKIDTHKDNISMQKFLKNTGFKYCGIIYLEDNNERLGFEKLIN